MSTFKVKITRLTPGTVFEVDLGVANAVVREILQQIAPHVARSPGDIAVNREYLAHMIAPNHPASMPWIGRLWGRLRWALRDVLLCDLCGGLVHEKEHYRHSQNREYLLASDILFCRHDFEAGDAWYVGPKVIADFKALCETLETQLNGG